MDIDVPKYRKRRRKKTVKKSNHKHDYKPCLVYMWKSIMRAERCEICGKINNEKFFETEPYGSHFRRMLSEKEIIEKYQHLKCYDKDTGQEIDINEIRH